MAGPIAGQPGYVFDEASRRWRKDPSAAASSGTSSTDVTGDFDTATDPDLDTYGLTRAEMKAFDAELADLSERLRRAGERLESAENYILSTSGARRSGGKWTTTFDQALEQLEATPDDDLDYYQRRALDDYRQRKSDKDAVLSEVTAANAEYTGWPRFFLVPGGHIHTSTSCHTLNPTTRLAWLPDLSGDDEATAVAEHGTILCTHCYPSAPVAWTAHSQAQLDAEKAEAKNPSCPGTGPVPGSVKRRYPSNRAICIDCGQEVTMTSTGKLRKHKA